MEMAGEILGQLLAACVGTAAFSALFGVPKKYWLDCGICGAVGWGVYLAVMAAYQTPIIGTFAASAVLTMLSRCLAIQRKAPTILFLVCGIFPLVPGAAIYYTAYNFFMGQEALALQYGMDTIKMAIAIGLGIGAAYSLPGHLFGWKLGMLMLGNLLRESGVTERLSDTAQNALCNIVTIMLGTTVGATANGEIFLRVQTIAIVCMGLLAFAFATIGGVLLGKVLCAVTGGKINPLIGSAGVSAVPMAARVSQTVGAKENPTNFLLMHAMGPNVAGVIGSAVAAGFFMLIFG